MILINKTSSRDIDSICLKHYVGLESKLKSNLKARRMAKWLRTFLAVNLNKIIIGKPDELLVLQKKLTKECIANGKTIGSLDKILTKIFNYDWFIEDRKKMYDAYDLAKRLIVNTCPYCNRSYTVTIENDKGRIVRPDFDHFFPKSDYPLLSLSFYNLIPCCPICNRSIKGSTAITKNEYIHPYLEGFANTVRFNHKPLTIKSLIGLQNDIKIAFDVDNSDKNKLDRCKRNLRLFKIKELYQASHTGEIAEIIWKHYTTGGSYLTSLKTILKGISTVEELYQIAFSNYYNEVDFEKRPLSKMTKDIFEQLKFTVPIVP